MVGVRQFDEQKVFAKALEHFAHFGSNGSSLKQLADEVGVQRGSLYNAYGNRHGLLRRAYAAQLKLLTEKVQDLLSAQSIDVAISNLLGFFSTPEATQHLFSKQVYNCLASGSNEKSAEAICPPAIEVVRALVASRIQSAADAQLLQRDPQECLRLAMVIIQGVLAEYGAGSDEIAGSNGLNSLVYGIFNIL